MTAENTIEIGCRRSPHSDVIMTSETSHVLAIVGSPRRGGNTEIIIDEILAGASDTGAMVEKIMLRDLVVFPCKGCDFCKKKGRCFYKDDMKYIEARIAQSDILVLGTPVYWWGPTAQFKAFLDRWYGVNREIFIGKKTILAIPLEAENSVNAQPLIDMFKGIMDYLGMIHVETVLALGVFEKGAIHRYNDLLEFARSTGQKAATNSY